MATKRHARWKEQLSQMDLVQLDDLIQTAERLRNRAERETELQRLRKELIARIVSSGYSFEEIFAGSGRFPQHLVRQVPPVDPRCWSANG